MIVYLFSVTAFNYASHPHIFSYIFNEVLSRKVCTVQS